MSNKNIDILRIWPDDNAIYDAIKTAYNDAARFIKTLGIKLDDDFDIDNVSGLDFNNDEFKLDNLNKNSFTNSSKVELDYILSTNKLSSLIEFQQNELFYTNGLMNISQIIQARTSHNTFLRSERPCKNRILNNFSEKMVLQNQQLGHEKKDGQEEKIWKILDYLNTLMGSIFLGKILLLYRSISMRHAYVSFSQDIDSLSYISVATFANTDGNFFSQICKSGGNIFAHIIPKQVIYHFDNSCLDVNNVANLPSRLCLEENSWKIFNFFSQKHVISVMATIFG
ncbi:hypothetical protein GLOIN_2v1822254 [Rhizophagus clarus]|uniref:Uncharacterized protein n=1 Tax=Rhizophagus clarus TaxID=94130 RepID=A0A8H3L0B5_9GLOM|nr:hypothetical protein GLOIN_2v1822254 [Rhizophagus clarus]